MNEYLKITNENNLDLMKRYEDNYFDLAIVDPPYGIGISNGGSYYNLRCKAPNNPHTKKDWDNEIPPKEYWEELFRVSKNQIVWGGNYMTEFLKPSRCWIFWDKMKFVDNYADGELAWTSFDRNTKKVQIQHHGFLTKDKGSSIHPTQKPAMLYGWIINNFCEKGFRLLDTHLGSGSIALAVDSANKLEKMELELVACELDEEYYTKAINRIESETKWKSLF